MAEHSTGWSTLGLPSMASGIYLLHRTSLLCLCLGGIFSINNHVEVYIHVHLHEYVFA